MVFTEFTYSPDVPRRWASCTPSTRWYDGFAGTELDGALRARGITSLVITGTMTDICVLSTVVGGFNHEYRMSVVEDGVATLWPDIQRATLDIIGRAFGRVVSSKDVLDTPSGWTQGAAR